MKDQNFCEKGRDVNFLKKYFPIQIGEFLNKWSILECVIHKYAPYKRFVDSVVKTALNYGYILLNGTYYSAVLYCII